MNGDSSAAIVSSMPSMKSEVFWGHFTNKSHAVRHVACCKTCFGQREHGVSDMLAGLDMMSSNARAHGELQEKQYETRFFRVRYTNKSHAHQQVGCHLQLLLVAKTAPDSACARRFVLRRALLGFENLFIPPHDNLYMLRMYP